jgi:hypothetical protein
MGAGCSSTQYIAMTDLGRVVRLDKIDFEGDLTAWAEIEDRELALARTGFKRIRTGPPDPASNCHGWVFADGRFWVSGDDVPHILADNGYAEVAFPEVGDVVCYQTAGSVGHTGVVHSTDADGQVLVESKWGRNSRFIHDLNDCAGVSVEYHFYRSARADGHRLQSLGEIADPASPDMSESLVAK